MRRDKIGLLPHALLQALALTSNTIFSSPQKFEHARTWQTPPDRLGAMGWAILGIFSQNYSNIQSTQPGFWGCFHTADGLADR
jgi:hypothetical protein